MPIFPRKTRISYKFLYPETSSSFFLWKKFVLHFATSGKFSVTLIHINILTSKLWSQKQVNFLYIPCRQGIYRKFTCFQGIFDYIFPWEFSTIYSLKITNSLQKKIYLEISNISIKIWNVCHNLEHTKFSVKISKIL